MLVEFFGLDFILFLGIDDCFFVMLISIGLDLVIFKKDCVVSEEN